MTGMRWITSRREVIAVVAGAGSGTDESRHELVHETDDGVRQYRCSGFRLTLHPKVADSYWYNLVGRQPSLFVICRPGDDNALWPFMVSANYDEAGAFMEADEQVFSVPMPPEVYRWVEEFVMTHYRPEPPRKRRRKQWQESSIYERRPDDPTRH